MSAFNLARVLDMLSHKYVDDKSTKVEILGRTHLAGKLLKNISARDTLLDTSKPHSQPKPTIIFSHASQVKAIQQSRPGQQESTPREV
jgi:hypothetical protein